MDPFPPGRISTGEAWKDRNNNTMKISQIRNETSQNFFPCVFNFSLCCNQIPCVFPVWKNWHPNSLFSLCHGHPVYSLTNKNQACDNQVKSCSNLNHFPLRSHWDQKCIWFALRNKVILNTKVETCVSLKLKRNKSNSQVNSNREESFLAFARTWLKN